MQTITTIVNIRPVAHMCTHSHTHPKIFASFPQTPRQFALSSFYFTKIFTVLFYISLSFPRNMFFICVFFSTSFCVVAARGCCDVYFRFTLCFANLALICTLFSACLIHFKYFGMSFFSLWQTQLHIFLCSEYFFFFVFL